MQIYPMHFWFQIWFYLGNLHLINNNLSENETIFETDLLEILAVLEEKWHKRRARETYLL